MKKISKETKEKSQLTKEEWKEFTKTVWSIANVSHPEHPAIFPDELPRRLIKLFSFWGETVLDPFGGVGTTARVALGLGRNAFTVDQNESYMKAAIEACEPVLSENTGAALQTFVGDCRRIDAVADNSISLVVTSPPYWDKANYGPSEKNIGRESTYQSFLREMREVFAECYRVLEPGRKICVNTANVNQFTDHGLLTFPIAADFCIILRDLGFVMINELIWSKDKTGGRWGSANSQRPIFGSYPYPPNFLFKNVHEYILVFAKPNGEKRKGNKVRTYADVMELPTYDTPMTSDKTPPSRTRRVTGKS